MRRLILLALFGANCGWSDVSRPDSHAPIGVMGDHTHKQGEFMFSYRYMRMEMQGNLDGDDKISADEIATMAPNRFFGAPMQPSTLRVVPTEMTMDMHMFGAMYAVSDRVTLMAMVNYLENEMEHITYMGGTGTTRLGTFTTESSGLGDLSVGAMVGLNANPHHRWHATVGVSLPTGDIDETDTILTPMNMRSTVRLPYPMQLGSGTIDLIAGLTYSGESNRLGWGGQWESRLRMFENDEYYSLGDELNLTAWASFLATPNISLSARLAYFDRDNISGLDPRIMAPVQTADPDRQAIERLDLGLGMNAVLPGGAHRLALEVTAPIHEDLDGPQLERDLLITIGYQYTLK